MIFGLRLKKSHLGNLAARLKALDNQHVKVGWFPENGVHPPSGLTYAGLAAIHHFGAKSVKIPRRPILDLTFSLYHPIKRNAIMGVWISDYFDDIHKKKPTKVTLQKLLDFIGGDYVEKTRAGFGNSFKIQSNTPMTIAHKSVNKINSPLIDTGMLRDELSYITTYNGLLVTPQ